MIQTKRIEYIDIAKGICILLLLLQHAHTYYREVDVGEVYMVSFRVPLFFLLSGCFFKTYGNYKSFLKKKFNTLIIPFLFFYLCFSVAMPNLLHLSGYEGLRQASSLGWMSIFNFIKGRGYSNNPVWFLLALFWLSNIFYGLCTLAKNKKHTDLFLLSLSLVTGLTGYFLGAFHIWLPMNLDNALTACPFFYVGYAIKNNTNILYRDYPVWKLLLTLVCSILFIAIFSPGIDFLGNCFRKNEVIETYGCGIMGTVGILIVSKWIFHNRILNYFGNNTLTVLCLQMPILQIPNMFITKFLNSESGEVKLLVLMLVASILLIISIEFMNRFLPYFTGKKALIK